MKKLLRTMLLAVMVSLFACSVVPPLSVSASWLPTDMVLSSATTDVVVVRHIDSRPFGQSLTEHEFVVLDRILGYAPDRIFVYTTNAPEHSAIPVTSNNIGFEFPFYPKTNYLLPLVRIGSPYAKTHEDGYTMINYIVIDLDNPSNSVELGRPLSSFGPNPTRMQIIQNIIELTEGNPPGREYIRSDRLEDIIEGSPYILVVEINRPLRLAHEQANRDWGETDLFYATVVQSLKGDVEAGSVVVVSFFAYTVQVGERHVVAVEPLSEGSTWFTFTSRNSLFSLDLLSSDLLSLE